VEGSRASREAIWYLYENARPQDPRSNVGSEEGAQWQPHERRESTRATVNPTPSTKWPSTSCQRTCRPAAGIRPRTSYVRQLLRKCTSAISSEPPEPWTTTSSRYPPADATMCSTCLSGAPAKSPATTHAVQFWPSTLSTRTASASTAWVQQFWPPTLSSACCSTSHANASASAFPDKLRT